MNSEQLKMNSVRAFWISFVEATRRDWATVKGAAREFFGELPPLEHIVIYLIASFILAAIIAAPWLSDNSEWAWK